MKNALIFLTYSVLATLVQADGTSLVPVSKWDITHALTSDGKTTIPDRVADNDLVLVGGVSVADDAGLPDKKVLVLTERDQARFYGA